MGPSADGKDMKRGTMYLSIISILEAYKNLGIQNDHE